MSRARILADYVSSGDELALKAPIAGPTFTGTVAIPNVANLETAVVANTAKVTNYNQTVSDINALDVTELGTVTSANLSNSAIVMPRFKEIDDFYDPVETASDTPSQDTINISHTYYVTITPDHADDILEFGWNMNLYASAGYCGIGIQRSADIDFSSPTTIWSTGRHTIGPFVDAGGGTLAYQRLGAVHLATCAGLTVDTPYYFRMIGQTHSGTTNIHWGNNPSTAIVGDGVRFSVKRWSIV